MKRSLHLGLTILCLLALAVVPILSGATLHAGSRGCSESMSHRMPMSPAHSVPPCCAVHSPDRIAPAALDVSLALPQPNTLPLGPLFAPTARSVAPRPSSLSASPPHVFPLPLRI